VATAVSSSLIARLRQFNADREPDRLAIKYGRMRQDAFGFFRGTAHLFYGDWPPRSPLDRTPLTWACGDLHLENFGSYKGENRLAYFDINDFDEAALAPAGRDLARFAVSALLAARTMGLPGAEARSLLNQWRMAYSHALVVGKALWIERSTARGLVKRLLQGVKRRTQADLIDSRTIVSHDRRRLKLDGLHALPLSRDTKEAVARALANARVCRELPSFFRVLDVARRIAGNGSLGVRRFAVLVEGHGGRKGNALLDLKEAVPSALAASVDTRQPRWDSQADRVVTIQRRVQAVSPALLNSVRIGHRSFILRELQPAEDRLALDCARNKRRRLADALRVMGEVVAWAQLRSACRDGSAGADEWVDFGHSAEWVRPLVDYSRYYADVVCAYWREFATAYDDGVFAERR
jgi:uncharacterized protein (DUF2252 family)